MQSKAPAISQPSERTVRGSDAGPSARTQASFSSSNDRARTSSNDAFFLHLNHVQYQATHDGYVSHENLVRDTFSPVIVGTVTFFIHTESAVTVDVASVEPSTAVALASAGLAVAENAPDWLALSLAAEKRIESPGATTAALAAELITNGLVDTVRQAVISGLLRASANSPDQLQISHSATLPAAGTALLFAIGQAGGGSALNPSNIRQSLPGSGKGMMQTAWDLLQGNSIGQLLALDPSFRPQLAGLLGSEMALQIVALERAVEALVMPMLQTGADHALYWLSLSCWLMAIALAYEATRRSWPQQVTYDPVLSVSCGLLEERS